LAELAQGALNLGSSESMSGDIDHVVDATHDPKITVTVSARAIAGKVNTVYLRPVLLPVTLVIAINCSQHGRPRAREHEVAPSAARLRIAALVDDLGGDAGEWVGSEPGFVGVAPARG
jgi:hypothetical protein